MISLNDLTAVEKLVPYSNATKLIKLEKNIISVKNHSIAYKIELPFNITPVITTSKKIDNEMIDQFTQLEIGINAEYFLMILKQLKTDCKIGFNTTISPITFITGNIDFLIMPLRIIKDCEDCDYKKIDLPTPKPAKKPAKKDTLKETLSGYYLFNVQSLYGITKDINMPNIVKELTITEYKAFQKLNVSKLTTLTV